MMLLVAGAASGSSFIRVNKVGYLPDAVKAAVVLTDVPADDMRASITAPDGNAVEPDSIVAAAPWAPFPCSARIYFSSHSAPGNYTISVTDADGRALDSATVYIGADAYSRNNLHELPLTYLRQQRCGYNPAHADSCHTHDGFLVLSGDRDGEHVDVTGGWHDASDYLQYLTTSANTVYNLLEAYRRNPAAFADRYDASGHAGANGVPDVLDEARWGLEWMLKMNPEPGMYLNQIADDRDHRFAGLPPADSVDYGAGPGAGRPVYPCAGYPYGLKGNLNRSTGEASSVGKFASSFGLGARVFADIDTALAATLAERSAAAYEYARLHPGACQTAPCVSPYFYEEDNWADDMELAAMERYHATGDRRYMREAVDYGRLEPVTPWMGADSARHYQWYPFVNLGHVALAEQGSDSRAAGEFIRNLRSGLDRVDERGASNAFRYGIPFIWCSNNLASAWAAQAILYRRLTGDNRYAESEAAVRDWLFGLNPWGQIMMILPNILGAENGAEDAATPLPSPQDAHSAMTDATVGGRPGRDYLVGGIVDGPVYKGIYNSLYGVHLRHADRYAPFQGPAVYHDDYADYSTNEPTMDGTASLLLLLTLLHP